ncbi:MAG: Holliday junction ATP-dependent DNA helicase RuvA [Candidatus Omnitrophica bacterium]|nr:Holliday junction ATP-dependent DNA helicase RuvA [Candidatus Omnitrophota bacterium]
MIARIYGKVVEKGDTHVLIDRGGIVYEVFVPAAVMHRIEDSFSPGQEISLMIYHYYQVEPSRSIPVLIGFLSEVEKEFFQEFITVSGIGPRAALRALNQPISLIANAIDEADINFLKSLPGIGQQRAKEIVAKLQHKVAKFGLIQDSAVKGKKTCPTDMEEEVLAVLMQLGYKKPEAQAMIGKALENGARIGTTEELLNEVYKQKKVK